MTRIAEKLTSSITTEVRARLWLRENGYEIDNDNWISAKEEVTFLFLRWRRKVQVGHLVFSQGGSDLSPSKKWLLEVHGINFRTMMEECGRQLTEEFNVQIHVVLQTEYTVNINNYGD